MGLPPVVSVILQLATIFAAYKLGQMTERPKAKWPKGTLMQGGWEAWRPYAMGIVGASLALQLLAAARGGGGGGGMFGMFGGGGGMAGGYSDGY